MQTALLRLFNGVHTENKTQEFKQNERLIKRSCKNGYVVDPRIKVTAALLDIIEEFVGMSGEKANTTFHKSWKTIQDTPQETLWVQAIVHYITTYGFQTMGMYNDDTIYIPHEQLDIPEITEDVPLVFIEAMTASDILNDILRLGSSGIALHEETLNDIMEVVEAMQFDSDFIVEINNRELKARLNDFYGIVPDEPVEFLRYVISKLCNESLIIKNTYMVDKIKESNGKFLDELMKDAPANLASIFFRFKPLFLAMKSISKDKTFYNALRKNANKMHIPVKMNYLDMVTAEIRAGTFDVDIMLRALEKASVFRKIKLAYALKARLNACESIVYCIRNGRGWATDFSWDPKLVDKTEAVYNIVYEAIVEDIKKNVDGRTIYIPNYINYAVPSTEKMFTGFFPRGSYVTGEEDLIVGIHWTNNVNRRVDLDLSAICSNSKIGWDSRYNSDDKSILFSGDITSAPKPKGATELFYMKNGCVEPFLLVVNDFNHRSNSPVDTRIIFAHEKIKNLNRNYMVDPNNIIALANIVIDKKQTILGLMTPVDNENRFYFCNASVGTGNVSVNNSPMKHSLNYMISSMIDSISLNTLLEDAGATLVNEKPKGDEYINLDPSVLDKHTVIDLIVR